MAARIARLAPRPRPLGLLSARGEIDHVGIEDRDELIKSSPISLQHPYSTDTFPRLMGEGGEGETD
jgi:hypothetical protein